MIILRLYKDYVAHFSSNSAVFERFILFQQFLDLQHLMKNCITHEAQTEIIMVSFHCGMRIYSILLLL